ncbi:BON1-associated protein 2-like [Magnolia sinica]|uniref:BON1-associated protein 2-like n=1 Tax=Magnolia sinica TaxID=86752 RepID=UPI002658D561|nr:BON1-associated protein 2-like [Magnolia sinica]
MDKSQPQFQSHSRFLEITVISAESLRISNHLIKKNAFVTVQTDPCNCVSTPVDRDGGGYPTWNEKLHLALPGSARSIAVKVLCKTASGSSKTVGMVNIPMSDFVGGYVPAHHLHFLSYRLRQQDGERNGIINLSIKMVGPENDSRPLLPLEKINGGIAVGIPVPYGCRV